MQIRSLEGVAWDVLAAAFTEAFSDYAVPMTMTAAALEAMQRRRGYVARASFGAYDGGRLVGFVLTCLDGERAYNSGTGVAPSHRRGGVARALLDAVIAEVAPPAYVLEVLEANAKAIAFYASAGFVETRRLACWTYDPGDPDAVAAAATHDGAPPPVLVAPDLAAIAAAGELAPAWQSSLASIRRAPEPFVALGDARGAAIVFPASADLPLLAVERAARRTGLGTRLLRAAAHRASRPLRILNLDDRATELAAFLAAAGAKPLVRQLEMIREKRGE